MNGRVCSFEEWNFAPAPFTIIIINIFFSKIIYFFLQIYHGLVGLCAISKKVPRT